MIAEPTITSATCNGPLELSIVRKTIEDSNGQESAGSQSCTRLAAITIFSVAASCDCAASDADIRMRCVFALSALLIAGFVSSPHAQVSTVAVTPTHAVPIRVVATPPPPDLYPNTYVNWLQGQKRATAVDAIPRWLTQAIIGRITSLNLRKVITRPVAPANRAIGSTMLVRPLANMAA
jgi:hypothetical protein